MLFRSVQDVKKITNYTKGYDYDVTNALIINNRTVYIDSTYNIGKAIDTDDMVFAEMITVNSNEDPAPTLTYNEGGEIITQIAIHPV